MTHLPDTNTCVGFQLTQDRRKDFVTLLPLLV
jgi:hypothetical protein